LNVLYVLFVFRCSAAQEKSSHFREWADCTTAIRGPPDWSFLRAQTQSLNTVRVTRQRSTESNL
jgi:hypothetical protein